MVLLTSELGIVLISIAFFLGIILLLVLILMVAKAKLSPQGEVTLKVNDKVFTVSPREYHTEHNVRSGRFSAFCMWWWRYLRYV